MLFNAIGLMSGTSLDGLDICHVQFRKEETSWKFEILNAETFSYPEEWEQRLRNSIKLSAEDLFQLNSDYGFYLGEQVKLFTEKFSLNNIVVVASHGHTVFHQPQKKFTVQIGDGRAIKIVTGLPVVYDFRSQDVLMGGNGAPLVPIGDELLFSEFDACLNIGGFSNISFKTDGKRFAFDICPVNIVLNQLAQNLGMKYDNNGEIAKSGTINSLILGELNSLEFYKNSKPKSLGVEWVKENILPQFGSESTENLLATFTEHASDQIAKTLNELSLKKILFTGGGTYNSHLVNRIREKTATEIIIPDSRIINFKEALIFAFMGVLRISGENNVLCSATGSSHDHSSGIIA